MQTYQEKIEEAHELTTHQAVKDALDDGELLAKMEESWKNYTPQEIIEDIELTWT